MSTAYLYSTLLTPLANYRLVLEFATGKRNNRVSVTTHYEELDDGTLVDKEKLKIAEINEWFEKAQDTIECLESLLPHERSGASATSE